MLDFALRTKKPEKTAVEEMKLSLRPDDQKQKRKATPKNPLQEIEITYRNYDQIFTEPVQLESRVRGQPVSIEPTERNLSEDFFVGLERTRSKGGSNLHIILSFSEESRINAVENEIRRLYKYNYEEDMAVSKNTVSKYKKESGLFFTATGVLGLIWSILDVMHSNSTGIFDFLIHKTEISKMTDFAGHVADSFLLLGIEVLAFGAFFIGLHLIKDKPDEMYERMKEIQRYLNARITIKTKDEVKRSRRTEHSSAVPSLSEQTNTPDKT